ncbi:MAG: mandelate racemase/muconate lactonizing enzyme family protein [Bryobacteraceae bacterium]|nr:mandelate racemase/muconate lactonizing enzyme family protein [Bryobacteraceae bacterium]MDW8376829.1 mandelate racemase/muconate lactonizing enzyme family protein [Bryobacterales bacterium]
MKPRTFSRRSFFGAATGALAASFWADQDLEAAMQRVNQMSRPSDLKITDLRVAVVTKAPMTCPLIRIDTNQGISGFGEVRDGAHKNYALMLKSRLLGENPCNVDKIFRKIKQFGGHARQGGGVCGVEMALWDLAGKAYNVPVYQMLGGKFRDRIRLYADTTQSKDPKEFAQRLKDRVVKNGFTFLKMDLGVSLVEHIPGTVSRPLGTSSRDFYNTQHMFTGMELTEKGVAAMADYVAQVREVIGMEVPLAADHFGHIGVNSCIRLGKALEKYNMAWLEDMIPWQYAELLKKITDAVDIPILTGEDIYLKEDFVKLARMHAVDIVHPDLATSGGILETKKIGDLCQDYGVPMAMHFAGTPISFMANVHCAAATENFLVLEHHSVDIPWWEDLVHGDKPLVEKGFAKVPDKPGLGVTLNDEVVKQHLLEPGYFEPTPQWDQQRSNDRLWS